VYLQTLESNGKTVIQPFVSHFLFHETRFTTWINLARKPGIWNRSKFTFDKL